jgi:hypothetical protein
MAESPARSGAVGEDHQGAEDGEGDPDEQADAAHRGDGGPRVILTVEDRDRDEGRTMPTISAATP